MTLVEVAVGLLAVAATLAFLWRDLLWKLPKILRLLRMKSAQSKHVKKFGGKPWSYADFFETRVDEDPDAVQLIFADNGEQRTRKEVDDLANQVAQWAQAQNYKPGDSCALMLLNQLDFPSIWLGIAKIGGSTALLNTNLFGTPFVHGAEIGLKDSQSKILIVDWSLKQKLAADLEKLTASGVRVFFWGTAEGCVTASVKALPTQRPPKALRSHVLESSPLMFIFTSGTTGLPKACKISHTRYHMAALFLPVTGDLHRGDVLYSVMPLYHSASGVLGLGGAFSTGYVFVTRSKFSASSFSAECVRHRVTAMQYIGELCRYLVAIPENPLDKQVSLRCAFGNGMRVEYWEQFQARYSVAHVVEFYAATEGNVALVNNFDKVGPLGFVPRLFDFVYPVVLVRVEGEDSSTPLRDERGFCIRCQPGEPGLMLSELTKHRMFDGYTDKKASDAKILHGVFRADDRFFNTGDLVSRDAEGYFYWCDRVGDTFRWKGENVSTTEVSEALSTGAAVKDMVVYGVSVPHCDGRAGMACVVPQQDGSAAVLDVRALGEASLPPYSRPLFLRVKKAGDKLPVTSTYKYVKADLVKQAFDPALVGGDELFYLDAKAREYKPIDAQICADIKSGKLRF